MKHYFIYIALAIVASLLMWGCSFDADVNDEIGRPEPLPDKPTVPIKKRPIVPTTKLPRPRIVGGVEWKSSDVLRLTLSESVPSAEVIITDLATGEQICYMFEGNGVEIAAIARPFELMINVGDQSYSYVIDGSDDR